MNEFWPTAGVLACAALSFMAVPLWQQRRRTGRWPLPPLVAAVALVPVAVSLYIYVRTWTPDPATADTPAAEMVAQLAARLAQDPEDAAGWRMLGKSYLVLGDPARARDAYREAWARTPAPDNELKLSLAEAEALADRTALRGDVARLLDEVLESEPSNPKALWYGGLAAFDAGHEDLARSRWSQLLALDPPEEIRRRLSSQFGVTAPSPVLAAAERPASTPGVPPAAGSVGPTIKLNVRLGQGVSIARFGPSAALFIFARAPGGGPPVAVIRQPASAVPGEFTLSDANSMIPGRSLGDYPEITVIARLSASGQPTEQPGDVYAQTQVTPGGGAAVDLVIDRVAQ